jgi:hypothetical protein
MATNIRRQENVDHHSKCIVEIPQAAFAKKHGIHTQSIN